MGRKAIVWFRNDLRLHDNEALTDAIQNADDILPIYVFDERAFSGKTKFGFPKFGSFRKKFLIESVLNLRSNLQAHGADLIIRYGKPEEIIRDLALEIKSSWVYCNRERTREELDVQDKLENNLWSIGQELRFSRGKMLFHTADLPFPISQIPDTYTAFRKEVEGFVNIREPFDSPKTMNMVHTVMDRGEPPTFDGSCIMNNHIENVKIIGGETAGLNHLHEYLWKGNRAASYKDTRDQLLGWDFSTKLSPWLAHGCLSPKYIMSQVKKYEDTVIKNQSTYWIFFELMWRDYFRLIGKKYGDRIFYHSGLNGKRCDDQVNPDWFDAWSNGNTGIPFIDANMRQLNQTGFMSNRGRQNVASFLVKELKLDWRMGAEYFESQLIDYDPCSNYGNWMYIAGIGNDPSEDRHFNIQAQAKKYDADGQFVKYWIPEIRKIDSHIIHTPEAWDNVIYNQVAYSRPIVDLAF